MGRTPFPAGTGIFETLLTRGSEVAELNRHLRRALASANELAIPMPGEETLRNEISEVLSRSDFEVGRLRISFSHDGHVITHDPYEESMTPARVTLHSTSILTVNPHIKSYPYDHRFAILDAARDEGFEDAIVFNSKNEITESAIANLVFRINGLWTTPPISAGLLPGVMRAIAIERCGVTVSNIHVSDIVNVEAGYLLSSLKIAQPISHIGDFALMIDSATGQLGEEIREKVQFFSVL